MLCRCKGLLLLGIVFLIIVVFQLVELDITFLDISSLKSASEGTETGDDHRQNSEDQRPVDVFLQGQHSDVSHITSAKEHSDLADDVLSTSIHHSEKISGNRGKEKPTKTPLPPPKNRRQTSQAKPPRSQKSTSKEKSAPVPENAPTMLPPGATESLTQSNVASAAQNDLEDVPGRQPEQEAKSAIGRGKRISLTFHVKGGIGGGYKSLYTSFIGKMLGSKNLAEKSGITLVQTKDMFTADIVVCQAQKIRFPASCPFHVSAAKKAGRYRIDQKLIFVESADTGSVTTPSEVVKDSNTLAVMKPFAWRNHGYSCNGTAFGVGQQRRHFHLIQTLNLAPGIVPPEPLTTEVASELIRGKCPMSDSLEARRKIMVVVPFPITLRDGESLFIEEKRLVPITSRKIDVMYVGSSWNKEKALSVHRSGLVTALQDVQKHYKKWNVIAGGFFDRKEYLKMLTNVKIFISPFGAGEWSFKDEEATLRGAVLMKPGAGFLESGIPIYHPNISCIDVRPDWKGIEKVLETYLGNLPLLQKIQRQAHYEVSRFRSMEHAVRQEDLQLRYSELVWRALPALPGKS